MNFTKAQLVKILSTKSYVAIILILSILPIKIIDSISGLTSTYNDSQMNLSIEHLFNPNLAIGNIFAIVSFTNIIFSFFLIDIISSDIKSGMICSFIANGISKAKIIFGYLNISLLFIILSILQALIIFIYFKKTGIITTNINQAITSIFIFTTYWLIIFEVCILFTLLIKSLFLTILSLWLGYYYIGENLINLIISKIAPAYDLHEYILFNFLKKFKIANIFSPEPTAISWQTWSLALTYFIILLVLSKLVLKKTNYST